MITLSDLTAAPAASTSHVPAGIAPDTHEFANALAIAGHGCTVTGDTVTAQMSRGRTLRAERTGMVFALVVLAADGTVVTDLGTVDGHRRASRLVGRYLDAQAR